MDVVSTSLVTLLQRIINVHDQELDTAAIEEFCSIVIKEVDGVPLASKLLAFWIQSSKESQALQALTLLDICMRRCGPLFISEIGKFRFLNEMIKLVSPKYLGNKTPKSVQVKVLHLLHQWTSSFPHETKIKDAYDMLKKQRVIKDELSSYIDNIDIFKNSTKVKNPIFEDEEKSKLLQKLLKSKNPDDLHAANRLIKTMVKEEEKRSQQDLRRMMDLESIQNNVKLLSDMLESYVPTQSKKEDRELMKELYESCERLQPTLERLAQETQNTEEIINIVGASEDLEKVRNKYEQKLLIHQNQTLSSLLNTVEVQESLLDLSSPDITIVTNTDTSKNSKEYDVSMNCQTDINLLKDIFENSNNIVGPFQPSDRELTIKNSSILQPINVKNTASIDNVDETPPQVNKFEEFSLKKTSSDLKIQRTFKYGHENLSLVSLENLLKQSDMESFSGINFTCNKDNFMPQRSVNFKEISENTFANIKRNNVKTTNDSDLKIVENEFKVESLANINISLETIMPGNIHPVTVIHERNGITVLLHFAKDSPRFDVSVIVVTTMSKNSKPLDDYLFQAVVPQKCKCRLQLPSSTKLPAHNPFLPPSAISQIMLIANPYKEILSLKFMLSYSMDGETITEMGEVESLPIQ